MKDLLQSILASKHTSVPGFIVLISALGEIWLPQFSEQFRKTREFAISYGLIMAAQLGKGKPDSTGNP